MSSLAKKTNRQQRNLELKAACARGLLEVEQRLKELSKQTTSEQREFKRHYMGTQLQMCCLTSPAVRALLKQGFTFQRESDSHQFAVWNHIWEVSEVFEAKSLSAMYLEGKSQTAECLSYFGKAKEWSAGIDNWGHSDLLSKFYASCLEFDSAAVLPVLQKWNLSKNPWKRRQSIVSLLYYSAGRKKYLSFQAMIALVANLIHDPDFYVQRGIGWTLRELGQVYPSQTSAFLKEHVTALSAVAYAAAVEKLPKAEKELFKSRRAKHRKAIADSSRFIAKHQK